MESGFGQNLEGFLIKGNLSLIQADIPAVQGDGSIEGSGTLYINNIREYDVLNGINIQDVLLQNQQITVPYTQPSFGPTTASFVIDGGVSIKTTTNATSITSGGGLTIAGGASISKNVNVGGILDVNSNRITSVALPLLGTDAANKDYVDSKTFGNIFGNFTAGQVIVGDTGGNIIGYDSFTFDGNYLSIDKPVTINDTTTAYNATTASLITLGGASFGQNVIIGSGLNMSGTLISNAATPLSPTDVATKEYVDSHIGGVDGNFTTGQVIIAASNGDAIRGYDNYTFDGTTLALGTTASLYIGNTNVAIGVGTGGSLTTQGGASFGKNVFIGEGLDVNMKRITSVADPVEDYDAVNKLYVDNLFDDENFLTLINDTTIPVDIADFVVSSDVRAFLSYVYVQYNQQNCAIYTLRGINRGSSWYLQKTFVGLPSNVDFFIRYDNGNGILQYTNTNVTGVASIRYTTLTEIQDLPNDDQINIDIANNVMTFQSIPELSFANNVYDAVKIIIYVSNDTANKYGMVFLNCVLKGNQWVMSPHSFGNVTGLNFSVASGPNDGVVHYTNTNNSGQYTLRVSLVPILKSQPSTSLAANTNTYTDIHPTDLTFDNSQSYFQMTAFVTVPDMNKHAFYEIEGVHCDGVWSLNSRFIGDMTHLRFTLETSQNFGTLRFINPNPYIAYLRYVLDAPLIFESLPVKRGGSGQTYLSPHAVLRGNGVDPILASNDFVYKDLQMKLGNESSVLLTNTSESTLTSYGGAIIGGSLNVKGVDITPSIGDLFKEQSFNANHNVTNTNITGFSLQHPDIKSFNGTVCITVKTNSDEYDALYDVKALRKSSGWIISVSEFGDNLGIVLSITTNGQVQYTSQYYNNWIETKIKYRGLTTTVP